MATQGILGRMVGLANGGTATYTLPRFGYYNDLALEIRGGSSAGMDNPLAMANFANAVEEIRIKVDGEEIWTGTGQFFLWLNQYYGYPDEDGFFAMHFARLWMKTVFGINSSRLGVHLAQTTVLEVKFKNTYYPMSVQVHANHEAPGRLDFVDNYGYRSIKRFSREWNSIGVEQVVDQLPQNGQLLHALHIVNAGIDHQNFNLDNIKVLSNNSVIHETNQISRHYIRERLGVPGADNSSARPSIAGMATIEFADKNLFGENLAMEIENMRIDLEWKNMAPGQYDIYMDATDTNVFRNLIPQN